MLQFPISAFVGGILFYLVYKNKEIECVEGYKENLV